MFFNAFYLLVTATRISDEATVILVTWTVTDPLVTTVSLEIQEGEEGQWQLVTGASGLSASTTEFKVTGLKADKSYRFRMDMRRPGEQNPVYVFSESGKDATYLERNCSDTTAKLKKCVCRGGGGGTPLP